MRLAAVISAGLLMSVLSVSAPAQAPQSGIAEVNGTKLYYEAAGSGRALVLIHGGAVDSRAWDGQFGEFAKHYRVIRYDLRGTGRSANPAEPFSNSEDLHALLNFLKVDQAYLLGISRGGGIGYDFTLEHPERVGALILVSSNLSAGVPAYEAMFERTTEVGKKEGAAAAARVWGLDPFQGPQRKEAVPRVLEIIEDNIVRFRRIDGSPAVRQLSSSDVPRSERLKEIKAPTFVVYGAHDNVAARANYERWAEGIAGARKQVFPNAAHLVPIDQPQEFNAAVLEFLGKLK
jgi:pimeloyl-ACP methyl ester carboxylesterase